MAKQKRKVLGGTEKQSKKRKKAPAEGPGQAPEARPDVGEPGLQAADAALSPEEQRVLQRKQKKARKQQLRAAGRTAQDAGARPSGAQLALDYLCGWAQKHASWRFQKTRQTWLLLHMFEEDKVPDEHFPTLLAYLEGLRGRARELTVQKAEALMRELDAAGGQDSPLDAAPQGKTQRLRQVLQLLS